MRLSRRMFALPWVLLALLLQVGAPVEAARMAAQMADPFASMPVCSPDRTAGGSPSDHQSPADHQGHECGLCAACAPVHAGAPPVAAAPAPTLAEVALARPQFSVQASPRGPPLRAPTARGPPPSLQTA